MEAIVEHNVDRTGAEARLSLKLLSLTNFVVKIFTSYVSC